MSRKSFLVIIGLTLLLVGSYLSVQAFAMIENSCCPFADGGCVSEMDWKCSTYGGEHWEHYLEGSWCQGENCVGEYEVWCDIGPEMEPMFNWYCFNDMSMNCESH